MKQRADRLLVERGFFESRTQAQAAIDAGLVTANGAVIRKPAEDIETSAEIVAQAIHPYVSRGGVKLAAALDGLGFSPKGRICLDVGASTGGFTEVLLERGARHVYAVDVGTGQLHESLQRHPGVTSMEQTDIRQVTALPDAPDFVTIDVSFISLRLVLPHALALTKSPAWLVALIKPQFEAGREHLKKGIVRDEAVQSGVCDEIAALVTQLGWLVEGVIPSPIEGGDGNREFLIGALRD